MGTIHDALQDLVGHNDPRPAVFEYGTAKLLDSCVTAELVKRVAQIHVLHVRFVRRNT
jgi:hypothetical protein